MSGSENHHASKAVIPYEVGYAKPPRHGQFKKGQSGNPRGRPKAPALRPLNSAGNYKKTLKYELSPEVLKDTFLEEAYRLVSINTGQGEEQIPIARAVIRALGVKAAKGHIYAQRLFAQTLFDIEAANRARSEASMDDIVTYKKNWSVELQRRADAGLPLDPPVPHPDDIVLNLNTGTVEVVGPLSDEEQAKQEKYQELLDEFRESEARYLTTLDQPLACPEEASQLDWATEQVEQCRIVIPMLEMLTGEREMPSSREVKKLMEDSNAARRKRNES